MKANPTKRGSDAARSSFYDFTLFSEVVVLAGAIFTPRQVTTRGRVIPLGRRATRSRTLSWKRVPVAYIHDKGKGSGAPTTGEFPPESEEAQWEASARRARLSWMDENPY